MDSIPHSVLRLLESLSDFKDWEQSVLELSQEIAQQIASLLLGAMDERLMADRDEGLRLVGRRERNLMTRFGPLKIERRLYRDEKGDYHFLLDEALGLAPGASATPSFEHVANLISSLAPFRQASDIIRRFVPGAPTHSCLHRMIQSAGEEKGQEEEQKRRALFEDGELPASEMRKAERLMLEADGVVVSLQREKKRRREMKLAFSYEGLEKCGKGRFRTLEKMVHAGFSPTNEFWQGFSVELASRYDLGGVKEVILGGDGASWIRGGGQVFPVDCFQLDRFHLSRALKRALGAGAKAAYHKACEGDLEATDEILAGARAEASEEEATGIAETRRYLASNAEGLADWRTGREDAGNLRGLGAAEGNIDKTLANRFKKRGMSWTVAGGHNMAKVIQMRDNGQLEECAHSRVVSMPEREKLDAAVGRLRAQMKLDPHSWLEAHLPALDGPHSDRPWAHMLRELVRIQEVV
jgi:hypothetical protein